MAGELGRALVVDDEETVRSLVKRIMQDAGYDLYSRFSGQSATLTALPIYSIGTSSSHKSAGVGTCSGRLTSGTAGFGAVDRRYTYSRSASNRMGSISPYRGDS